MTFRPWAIDFRVQCRKRWYQTVDEMQTDLDAYLVIYNAKRHH